MPTYFAGSSLDALTPSLAFCREYDGGVAVNSGGYAEAFIVDPTTGLRSSVTRLWSHARAYGIDYDINNGTPMFSWHDEAGVERVRLTSLNNLRYMEYLKGGAWVRVGSGQKCPSGTFDVLIVVHPTQGRLAWFFNGNLASDVRGIDTSSIGRLASMRLLRTQTYNGETIWEQVLLASYNTIGHVVKRRSPSGEGGYTEWSGAFSDVNEAALDDTTAISAMAVGERRTFKAPAFALPSPGNLIKSLVVAARVRNDGEVVPTNVRAMIRVNGADFEAPANMPITPGFAGSHAVFDRNPATGQPWGDIAEINNGGEFGFKAVE